MNQKPNQIREQLRMFTATYSGKTVYRKEIYSHIHNWLDGDLSPSEKLLVRATLFKMKPFLERDGALHVSDDYFINKNKDHMVISC